MAVLEEISTEAVRALELPRRSSYFPSPSDWSDEIIYFMLPDRFSDGLEESRPLLDPNNRVAARPGNFRFDKWAQSGGERYQGGTIRGITSKLEYIRDLGATTLWVGPVFKQRAGADSYHGYAIQNFLEVEPRLGTRHDLVDLVDKAHHLHLRVLLDVVFNHTGDNWLYANGQDQPSYLPWPAFYPKGKWRANNGDLIDQPRALEEGVWPKEFQRDEFYTRAGKGDLGSGKMDDPHAEFRRTDFFGDRDVNYDAPLVLDDVARCYKYWIALADPDGFRIDTLKHLDEETGRNLCGAIKEYAANLGKADFFLVGEVAGSDSDAERYRRALTSNLNATLDIGDSKLTLASVGKGLTAPGAYFDFVRSWRKDLGSHRNAGRRHVTVLEDHDYVLGPKLRFSTDAASDHQIVAAVALQLFSLGIPCIYYGTEQAFAGPEKTEREKYLPDYGCTDKFLREAMFGPLHPRKPGGDGNGSAGMDLELSGFGPFGTVGAHCFNRKSAAYVRIAALAELRRKFPVLRYGREYQREISNFGAPFALPSAGEIIAWSRILDDEEALCIVNGHGLETRGGDVLVDFYLNSPDAPGNVWHGGQPSLEVVGNSAQAAAGAGYAGTHALGSHLPVKIRDGKAYAEIREVQPSEVIVAINR
jgi:glycosidase